MIKVNSYGLSPQEQLDSMVRVIKAQAEGEQNALALVCNATAIMDAYLGDINWIGFYLMQGRELVLGPFQGKPACTRIKFGEGVCGTSVQDQTTMLIADVDAFPGHIACDSASRSEVVVPIQHQGEIIGVIDCDSPSLDRFTEAEARALEEIADFLAVYIRELI